MIGTVGTRIAGTDVKTALTTPEAPDLHALFAVMREHGVTACAMEVSSHALVMGRVDGVVFDVAVFTNLGRDHLDFHADVEDYFAAKAALFTPERAAARPGQPRRRLRSAARSTRPRSRCGPSRPSATTADWRAVDVEPARPTASTFAVDGPDGQRFPAGVPLAGDFNVANALCAIAALGEAGLDAERRRRRRSPAAPGCPAGWSGSTPARTSLVVVDYAHKPDAVDRRAGGAAAGDGGRLIVVIGAGGDRDPGKRPLMGEIAARLADVLVVTDDNPRTEDPAAIRAEIARRCAEAARAEVRRGRRPREAIAPPSPAPARATPCWSPARVTRPDRRSAAWCSPSTTATCCATRSCRRRRA